MRQPTLDSMLKQLRQAPHRAVAPPHIRGLEVWPLGGARRAPVAIADTLPVMSDGREPVGWRESSPAHPRHLVAWSPSERPQRVDVGTMLGGGMCARIVRSTTVVPARGETLVDVVPIGSRWHDAGPVRTVGAAHPVIVALALQAMVPPRWVASSALTTLSSVFAAVSMAPDGDGVRASAGAVITFSTGIERGSPVAAWLLYRQSGDDGDDGDEARDVPLQEAPSTAVSSDALAWGALTTHVLGSGPWGRDIALLPVGSRFVDAVARGLP